MNVVVLMNKDKIRGATLTVSPSELLLIARTFGQYSENFMNHPIDRAKAVQMGLTIKEALDSEANKHMKRNGNHEQNYQQS